MLKVVMGPRLGTDTLKFEPTDDVLIMDEWFTHDGVDPIERIIKESNRPRSITSEHYANIAECSYRDILNPASLFFYHELVEFSKLTLIENSVTTNCCFSFMINRKRLARVMLLRMINYFKLSNFNYSLCFSNTEFDASIILRIIDCADIPNRNEFKSTLLGPCSFPPRTWINSSHTNLSEVDNYDYGDRNAETYNSTLKLLFDTGAVSVIVETVGKEKATVFTEKTLMPILSLTFPLWFGGYQQAQHFKELGFDIFDDVIDHSYQHRENYVERCYYALADNIELLSNLELATCLRNQHLTRLIQNREYATSAELKTLLYKKLSTSNFNVVQHLVDNFLYAGYFWT